MARGRHSDMTETRRHAEPFLSKASPLDDHAPARTVMCCDWLTNFGLFSEDSCMGGTTRNVALDDWLWRIV